MRLFGFDIVRSKKIDATAANLMPLDTTGNRGWWRIWPLVRESFPGAWQQNIVATDDLNVLAQATLFACVTLIGGDIAKMRWFLEERDSNGIWVETEAPAFSPLLRKPNRYQSRIKFAMYWIISKLRTGNTYVLKERNDRNTISALYILDPSRVTPLVAEDGSVYYQLQRDPLSTLVDDALVVPASEIIHDIMYPLYHPLVGVGPVAAAGLTAIQGLKIQKNSTAFFANGAILSGFLSAPGAISKETADRLAKYFNENFSGENAGKVAVGGDGLKFEPFTMKAIDAQLIEQLKWTAAQVPVPFHIPAYKVGAEPPPAYNNIEALEQGYYAQALQEPTESLKCALTEGLELPSKYRVNVDLDDLLRMDTATMIDTLAKGVQGALFSPNDARKRINYPPVAGGETPYLQEQNWPLELLAERELPTRPPTPPAPMPPQPPPAAPPSAEREIPLEAVSDVTDSLVRKALAA